MTSFSGCFMTSCDGKMCFRTMFSYFDLWPFLFCSIVCRPSQIFLSGCLAGVFTTVIVAPGERIKCLLQVRCIMGDGGVKTCQHLFGQIQMCHMWNAPWARDGFIHVDAAFGLFLDLASTVSRIKNEMLASEGGGDQNQKREGTLGTSTLDRSGVHTRR